MTGAGDDLVKNYGGAPRRRGGFTLIEVLVSAGLLGVGIFAVLGAMGAIAKLDSKRQQSEYMRRLAERRYEENLQINQNLQNPTSGDFQDWNEPNYSWSTTVATTGATNLYAITLTVTPNGRSSPTARVTGVVYIPSQSTTTTGAP
jgi:Tfp pilus assembly protein PilV